MWARRVARLLALAVGVLALTLAGCDLGEESERETGTRARESAIVTEGVAVRAGQWELTVTDVRTTDSLAGSHNRTFEARPDEVFLVVETELRRRSAGQEAEVASRQAVLVRGGGSVHPADGAGEEGEVCLECQLELSTGSSRLSVTFVFVIDEASADETFAFRYASSPDVLISASGRIEPDFAPGREPVREAHAQGWERVEPGGGTVCARGGRYAFWFHRGSSDRLLVYFQAGGGCFDARSCAPGSSLFDDSVSKEDSPAESGGGILDFDDPENPFRRYSILFIPSCTGDVHWGDNVATYSAAGGREVTIHHYGFVNASAALQWAYERVPDPRIVFVAGCSAGSVGSAAFAPYIIERYGNARVAQLGDSLAFVFHRPIDLQEGYRAHDNFPRWIPALRSIRPGGFAMASYYAAIARHYPRVRFSQFNFSRDRVQRLFYEAIGGRGGDFAGALRRSLAEIRRRAANFRCYTADGDGHCILDRRDFYTHVTGGIPLRDWVADLAAGRPVANVPSGASATGP